MGDIIREHDTSMYVIEAQITTIFDNLAFEMNNACGDRRGSSQRG